MSNMLRKSRTLGYAACACVQCNRENGRVAKLFRRKARRRERQLWRASAGIRDT